MYPNAERYEGNWVYGKRHGSGVYFYLDGGRYDGEWVDDRIQGRGKSIYANSNVYEGDWVDGRINGFGTLTYADGDKCVPRRAAAGRERGEARRGSADELRSAVASRTRPSACAAAETSGATRRHRGFQRALARARERCALA